MTALVALSGNVPWPAEGVALDPVFHQTWWFGTAYVLLLFVLPVVNGAINWLAAKFGNLGVVAFAAAACFLWWSPACFYPQLGLALTFYALGAFCRRIDVGKVEHSGNCGKRGCGFQAGCWRLLAGILFWIAIPVFAFAMPDNQQTVGGVLCRVSGMVASFFIFRFFAELKLPYVQFVNSLASTTFGVYLIHDYPPTRQLLWNRLLRVFELQYPSAFFPVFVVLDIVVVFGACAGIESVRNRLFSVWKWRWCQTKSG